MRIVSWNCKRNLSKKADALMSLDPDLAVIQECEQKFVAPAGYKYLWTGMDPTIGLGVLTKDLEGRVEPTPNPSWTLFLPVVLPRLDLRLLAVWAFQQRAPKMDPSRVGFIGPVLEELGAWLAAGRSVMTGDFNDNLRWDTPRGKNNFRPLVHRLRSLGLRSAYHEATLEGFNVESKPTHFFRHSASAPYHIDFCFLHHTLPFSAVEVLAEEPWTGMSDHVPIVVDVK